MGLTLDQLVVPRTKEQFRTQLLLGLQGISYVAKTGSGAGSVSADGVSAVDSDVRVKITTAGEPGSAYFAYSLDGGVNYTSPAVVPSGGTFVLPSTGVTLTFGAGPVGAGNSFAVGDAYRLILSTPTFAVTAWQPGSTPLTLIENDSEVLEDVSSTIAAVAKGGLLETAEDDWLDLWLSNVYGLQRLGALTAVGNVTLTDSAGAGPFTITSGQVWAGTAGGLRFNNVNGGTLAKNGTLSLSFRAEQPGSVYNVGAGSISVLFTTTLPGATVSNPDPIGGSWITTAGTDKESNPAGRVRARSRWPSLGIGTPGDTYDLWAKTAQPSVTRTLVRASPTVPGQVDIFLANQAGPVSGGVVTAVQAYVSPRAPLTTVPVVASASAHAYTVAGTVYVHAGYAASAAAAISQNLVALNGGGVDATGETLPGVSIGGTPGGGTVYRAEIVEQIQTPAGVRNVNLGTLLPATDIVLADAEVAQLTCNIVTNGTGNPATDLCIVEV